MFEFWDGEHEYYPTDNQTALQTLINIPKGGGEPRCVHMQQSTRICQIKAVNGYMIANNPARKVEQPVLPLLQASLAPREDIFAINFGIWYQPTADQKLLYQQDLKALADHYTNTKNQHSNVIFTETIKKHWGSVDGEYKPAGDLVGVCTATPNITFDSSTGDLVAAPGSSTAVQELTAGHWRNIEAYKALGGVVPLGYTYNASVPLWYAHNPGNCMHFCHPSSPQMWVASLLDALIEHVTPLTGTAQEIGRNNRLWGTKRVK